jgi:ribosomal protein S18 acetylase RimI-like enzyme
VDGRAVATGAAHRTGDVVGVSNIVTDPGHRRRGLGAVVTRALCALAAREGARCAYLQASDEAVGLYGSLGFRTVEHWSCWATPD